LYFPGEQLLQSAVFPSENFPAAQVTHDTEPENESLLNPAAQDEHGVLSVGLILPALQGEHSNEPTEEYDPAEHSSQVGLPGVEL
jgi:hypothetical protein